jgi:transposase
MLTGGEASDYGAVNDLMAIPVKKPKALLADKGYDGDAVRANLLKCRILPIIPPKANRRQPILCHFRRYRDRNRNERMFGHLTHQRCIVTRYDKTELSFASFLNLAAIRRLLPNFLNRTQFLSLQEA